MTRLAAFALVIASQAGAIGMAREALPGKEEKKEEKKALVLPGVRSDGAVQLPNQWNIRPVGRQIELGDFPVNSVLHPSGKWLAVLHAGYGEHEIAIVNLDPKRPHVMTRVPLQQTFNGLCFSADGSSLYASGGEFDVVHAFRFEDGYLSRHKQIPVAKDKFIVGGLAARAGKNGGGDQVFAAGTWGHAVRLISIPSGEKTDQRTLDLGQDSYPYTCLADPDGKRVYVSLWNKAAVAVCDLHTAKITHFATEKHPTEMVLSPDGKTLFVACANSTRVSVINVADGKGLETINCALYPNAPNGNTPNSLALTPDGELLFVANADANNVAVFNVSEPGKARPLGFIPTGMYPTSVRFNPADKKLYITNGRGSTVKANVHGPNPLLPKNPTTREYIAGLYRGTLSILDVPTEERMIAYSKQALLCSPLREDLGAVGERPEDNPLPGTSKLPSKLFSNPRLDINRVFDFLAKERGYFPISDTRNLRSPLSEFALRNGVTGQKISREQFLDFNALMHAKEAAAKCPIKYCIYVIRENRTYDQVFGDMKEGNGDPSLCIFPEKITPNAHRLARQFVLLDNFYCEGEVSAEGHEWSMGAYCTDFVKRVWPLSYRGSPTKALSIYPAEGTYDSIARPAGGYIWDRCAEAGVSYRSYGEWIQNGKTPKDPGKARVKALEGHFDPGFRGYDLDYPDVKRAERFLAELKRFEKEGKMPQLQIVRLPNDHTYGTKEGKPTPTAMVAENDLALGILIEGISKSKFWNETAIFVVEDDAQNGSDHVDAHRTVALVISPYTKRGFVDSTMYSTASMLRTMELILGLRPMSQFDAAARPMYHSFQPRPNLAVYTHVVPEVDMTAKNLASAWGSKLSDTFDFSKEDAADDLLFNEVIWRSVRGANSPMPPPVRAAFIFPHLPKE